MPFDFIRESAHRAVGAGLAPARFYQIVSDGRPQGPPLRHESAPGKTDPNRSPLARHTSLGMIDRPRLLSVNIAAERTLRIRGQDVRTGIYKDPAVGRVRVNRLGLEGDFQADPRYHGGPEKAVYLYPSEYYPHFRQLLSRPDLSPGFFGENFTTEGVLEEDVNVGDVFRVGTTALQVTTPRSPCLKLGAKVGSQRFVKTFLESRRLGFYLAVLEEGEVGAGDLIQRIAADPAGLTVAGLIERRTFSSPR
jgi:MOSC domain-containing protein YiiM